MLESKLFLIFYLFISVSIAWDSVCIDVRGHETLPTPQNCEGIVLAYDSNNDQEIVFEVPGKNITKILPYIFMNLNINDRIPKFHLS